MPAASELEQIEADFLAKRQEYRDIVSALPLAPDDKADNHTIASITAEGTFFRYFTLWENSIEKSFVYFCRGGKTLNGHQPICKLTNCDEATVKKILIAGQRYLDWSDQQLIRARAALFFENGMPFYDPIIGKSHVLSDAEKIRNVIAHDSAESWNSYKSVERNNFQTERSFQMPAGQMLRARAKKRKINWGEFYFDEVAQIFAAILRP
jgi:hypothetical protein